MTAYEQQIVEIFRELALKNGDGASPDEVATEMHRRDVLGPYDTVIDIADQMKLLRDRGLL